MEVISLRGVSKAFGEKKVLEGVNLSVAKGEIVGLVGKSGSGKSVLIKIIIGFLEADRGEVHIEKGNKINFSMQNNSIQSHLSVKQNLTYFSKMYGLGRKERKQIVEEILVKLDLKNFERVLVKNLSGGTQKRVDIGCALLNNPDIIILDEPFLGLDPELVRRLGYLIMELNKKGKTIIISSHDLSILSMMTSKFVLVQDGRLNLIKRGQLAHAYQW